jgi:large subunit ribosomal protein L13
MGFTQEKCWAAGCWALKNGSRAISVTALEHSSFFLTHAPLFVKNSRLLLFNQGRDIVKKYTYSPKSSDNPNQWYLVDANGAVLGRLASQIAARLRGKTSPLFSPHEDMGDSVVVINAEKIRLTGNKLQEKMYYHHSGYPGGLKSINAGKLLQKRPQDVLRFAVKGMLPKNSLGRKMLGKLKIYAGPEHPHEAQQPAALDLA